MNKIPEEYRGIIGTREGGDPENEIDNFYTCDHCKQSVDMRDLGQVFYHEQDKHSPLNLDS
jgi:hypothetical protein